jgi:DNA polymerase-3 subunit gamma/tau
MASPRPADESVADLNAPEPAAATVSVGTFEAVIALAAEKRDITMRMALERDVRLVRCEDGQLEIGLEANAPKTLVHDLQRKLTAWTGKRWIVVVSKEQGAPTVRAQAEARQADLEVGVQSDPLVQAVLNRFPGAKIVGVTQNAPEAGEPAPDAPNEDDED